MVSEANNINKTKITRINSEMKNKILKDMDSSTKQIIDIHFNKDTNLKNTYSHVKLPKEYIAKENGLYAYLNEINNIKYYLKISREDKSYNYVVGHMGHNGIISTKKFIKDTNNYTNKSPITSSTVQNGIINKIKPHIKGYNTFKEDLEQIGITLNNILAYSQITDEFHIYENKQKEKEKRNSETNKPIENEYNIDEVIKNATELITFLKDNNMEFTPYLYNKILWINGGEAKNTLIGTIVYASTYLSIKAINLIIVGKSAEGKTLILESAKLPIPDEAFESGRKTEAVLYRLSQDRGIDYLNHKILRMGDLGGKEDKKIWSSSMNIYKELNSEGQIENKEIVGEGKNEDGERNLLNLSLKGHPSITYTDVDSEGQDSQNTNRGIVLTTRATNEDVKIYRRYNKGIYKRKQERIIKNDIKSKIQDYFRYIKHCYKYNIDKEIIEDKDGNIIDFINPFYFLFENWLIESDYYKRSSEIYECILNTITLMNAPFREYKIVDGYKYFIVAREDIELISELFNPASELSPVAIKIYNKIVEWYTNDSNTNTYQEKIAEEIKQYDENDIGVKDFKYLFTTGTISKKTSNIKDLKGIQVGEPLRHLFENNKLNIVDKTPQGKNIYHLEKPTKIKDINITIDNDKIEKYCEKIIPELYNTTIDNIPQKEDQYIKYTKNEDLLEIPKWHNYKKE